MKQLVVPAKLLLGARQSLRGLLQLCIRLRKLGGSHSHPFVQLISGPLQLRNEPHALHGDGHLVGHRLHQIEILPREAASRLGSKGDADHFARSHQRVAGVSLDAVRFDELRSGIGNRADVFHDHTDRVPGYTSTDRHPIIQPFNPLRFLVGNSREGIEMESSHLLVHDEVEERMAVEVLHDLMGKLTDDSQGIFCFQQS